MAHSGFPTRKQEADYDRGLVSMCELLAFKVMDLVRVCDHEQIDMDESSASTHKHKKWAFKFFEALKSVYKLEKTRYQEPKVVDTLKPLA